jgi:transaldolase
MLQQNPLRRLHALGQSVWLDYIRRDLVRGPDLVRMIRQDALAGMTSNPTIFHKAIAESALYDDDIARYAARGLSAEAIYERLVIADVTTAADAFRSVWEDSGGNDGFVSLEVSPHLAHDAAATLAEAKRLYNLCSRPNVMIKIPGTAEGLTAIREALFVGINVNVTLLFGVSRYQDVLRFYLDGLDQRLQMKQAVRQIRSVASFFVSRVDTAVDARLVAISKDSRFNAQQRDLALSLVRKAAVANARRAYAAFQEAFSGPIYRRLAQHQIAKQRPLWASTSTKDPALADLHYVEALIGPETIDTMPPATLDAFRDHGRAELRINEDPRGAQQVVAYLASLGIDLDAIGAELEADGVAKFAASYDALLGAIEAKRAGAAAHAP